jgi:hypothetical protein
MLNFDDIDASPLHLTVIIPTYSPAKAQKPLLRKGKKLVNILKHQAKMFHVKHFVACLVQTVPLRSQVSFGGHPYAKYRHSAAFLACPNRNRL